MTEILECLVLEDEILVSRQGVRQFLNRYARSGTIARKPGSGLPPKLSPAIQRIIEETMRNDDETTATQLQAILAHRGVYVSLATIVRNICQLGWIYRGSAYCQLVMRLQYNWKTIDAFATARRERSHIPNLGPSTLSRCTCGQVLARKAPLQSASLKA